MKKQIIIIHGGDTFKTYKDYLISLKRYKINFERFKTKGWKDNISKQLGKNFEVISPRMPNPMNAKYNEWKIMFDKLQPFFKNNLLLIGHSLGGIFLAKYLSENKFSKKIKATFLIAAPYGDKNSKDYLGDFILPKNLGKLQNQGGKVFIYHSQDDPVVPFSDFKKYQKSFKNSISRVFTNRGHFNQERLPELVRDIKTL